MQNKKIQLWALGMFGYNFSIEYVAGTTNTYADLLSKHPYNVQQASDIQSSDEVEDQTVLDVNDNLYEVNIIDSNQFHPKPLQVVSYLMMIRLKNVIVQTSVKLVLT